MRPSSLRGRLLALLLGGVAVAWIAIAAATYFDAREHTTRLLDAQLLEYSEVLGEIAGHEALEIAGATTRHDRSYGQACSYQVYALDGSLLLRSHDAPNAALTGTAGFSDVSTGDGRGWRAYRRIDAENGLVVIVAHASAERDALVRDLALRLVIPLAVGLPLLSVVLWLGVARALRPLDRLAREVGGRGAGHLEPLPAIDVPAEVGPLVAEMNRLFERLDASLTRERRFTGDAAHELRTPLAALRTHAEVALGATSEERRRRSLEQVVQGVERATRVVEQMLALARLDADRALAPSTRVDLDAITNEAVRESRAAARFEGAVEVGGDLRPHEVDGDAAMLRAMLRNLIDNALRFSPPAGPVRVRLARDASCCTVEVEDAGPGVVPEMRERIFDRIFRGDDPRGAGSGLGLALVRRVVELHGGQVTAGASDALGGLRLMVELPAAG